MEKCVVIQKREGETPLQALESYRTLHPELAGVPMTYAGRLDPMASGELIILIGEECKNRDAYTNLDKEYEFEILFGVASDTGDILGVLSSMQPHLDPVSYDDAVSVGTFRLPYPAYSSKTVGGVPLHVYARTGRLADIRIPERDMTVYEVSCIGTRVMSGAVIRSDVSERLGNLDLGGDFRLAQVRASWDALPDGAYSLARYRARVSSGTYVRSVAGSAGKKCGVPALAYSIHRTKIFT